MCALGNLSHFALSGLGVTLVSYPPGRCPGLSHRAPLGLSHRAPLGHCHRAPLGHGYDCMPFAFNRRLYKIRLI
jgi:hypothetical protein